MGPFHFHPLGRDGPHAALKIELRPFGTPKFTRPDKNVRRNLESGFGLWVAVKSVNGTQERANFGGLNDCRTVFYSGCYQCSTKID